MATNDKNIILTGGAGLVGQNLCVRLLEGGQKTVTVIDKNANNLSVLQRLHPDIRCINADLSVSGDWCKHIADATHVVMLQAQIGALEYEPFYRNNILATELVLKAINPEKCHLTHISSSVVNSVAEDFYTQSKTTQEELVKASGVPHCILRPTLMFGWFDRKHLGWLARFMSKSPVFPIPGDGQYLRQPLYVSDFCKVIHSIIEQGITGRTVNISGKEKIYYIDIIRAIKQVQGSRSLLLHLPYGVFDFLLKTYALLDKNPPFTSSQLSALVADEVFELVDWEFMFGVEATPFDRAIQETLTDPTYSDIALEF